MARRLHLGGTVRTDGWEVFNAIPGDHVDHKGNANDLSRFTNGTFDELYGSHIVEHFDYKDELLATLRSGIGYWHQAGYCMSACQTSTFYVNSSLTGV